MNADDDNLRLYTIYFLSALDNDGFTRYYKKELQRRYREFCDTNRAAKRYEFRHVLSYMKSKKYVYMVRQQVVLKKLYIHLNRMASVIFIMPPGSKDADQYYVCQVCDRGFASRGGLFTHQQCDSHKDQLNLLGQLITTRNECPIMNCPFRGQYLQDVLAHFSNDHSVIITPSDSDDSSTDSLLANRFCELCSIRCTSEGNLQQHIKGKKHRVNEFRQLFREKRSELVTNKGHLRVEFEDDANDNAGAVLDLTGNQNIRHTVKIVIRNGGERVAFKSYRHFYFYDSRTVTLLDSDDVSDGVCKTISRGGSYIVQVNITPNHFGRIRIPILFIFQRHGEEYKILREVVYRCVPDEVVFAEVQPTTQYVKPKVETREQLPVVRSKAKSSADYKMALERYIRLENYLIPDDVRNSVTNISRARTEAAARQRWDVEASSLNVAELNSYNYSVFYNNLLYLEELQMENDIAQYTMKEVSMREEAKTGLLVVEIPGLAENRPSVLRGDSLYVIRLPLGDRKYEGKVRFVERDTAKLEFDEKLTREFVNNMTFKVEFEINRFTLRVEHRAVSEEMVRYIKHILFPSPSRSVSADRNIRFFNRNIEKNEEQSMAVRQIVLGTSGRAPYLIYGPPGTGKTSTLVEAIKQVWDVVPNCRILACAPQNAAADLLVERLLLHVDKKDILRLNAPSRYYDDINSQAVKSVSNYVPKSGGLSRPGASRLYSGMSVSSEMEVEFACRDELKQRKIIVCTLATSGRLVSAEMTNHFTHIFIDEAGHATEPETVIPLAGLIRGASPTQVVLAGDPKQLGPVIRSPVAGALGQSMLERLMGVDLYKRNPQTHQFNPDYVTKLVKSFRSHPDIMEVPNACFYDNELQACADRMQRERFCNWEGLPTKGFPMIFFGVNGQEDREGNSPSWFNADEVAQVVEYVRLLMECKSPRVRAEHIGIISPYHKQVNKIKRGLEALERKTSGRTRNYKDIAVGSVERFQGNEREVIIISTVRSQDSFLTHDKDFNLGFIGNPKRFNVAVTRAKALLIVVGNPNILRKDRHWQRLMNHIEEGGGYKGCPPPDEVEGVQLTDLTNMMECMSIKEALSQGVSEHQQQGNLEWWRKE